MLIRFLFHQKNFAFYKKVFFQIFFWSVIESIRQPRTLQQQISLKLIDCHHIAWLLWLLETQTNKTMRVQFNLFFNIFLGKQQAKSLAPHCVTQPYEKCCMAQTSMEAKVAKAAKNFYSLSFRSASGQKQEMDWSLSPSRSARVLKPTGQMNFYNEP